MPWEPGTYESSLRRKLGSGLVCEAAKHHVFLERERGGVVHYVNTLKCHLHRTAHHTSSLVGLFGRRVIDNSHDQPSQLIKINHGKTFQR